MRALLTPALKLSLGDAADAWSPFVDGLDDLLSDLETIAEYRVVLGVAVEQL